MKRKISWLAIAAIALSVVCVAIIVLGVYGYISLDTRIRILESQSQQAAVSEMRLSLDFLKEQQQMTLWQAGLVITGIGAILAFFGFTTRKSIEEKYDLKYRELMAAKDTKIFEKKTVFLYQSEDEHYGDFRCELSERGYNTRYIQISPEYDLSRIDNATIIVYRLSRDKDSFSETLTNWCENNKVHCVLYCPDRLRAPDAVINSNHIYVSTSIQIAKLRESLYTLLYLTP